MATSQLLILGNGFDLHCGLNSSYKDFFRTEILDVDAPPFDIHPMQFDVSGFWERLLYEYYKIHGEKDYSWCDVENIIKKTLLTICFGKRSEIDGIWRDAFHCAEQNWDPCEEGMRLYNDPIERYLYVYCAEFFYKQLSRKRQYSDQDRLHLLVSKLLNELQRLEIRFCRYLKGNIFNDKNELNEKYVVGAANLLAKLTGFSDRTYNKIGDVLRQEERLVTERISPYQVDEALKTVKSLSGEFSNLQQVHILSFNYTALFDILGFQSPCEYGNVHGKLCMENCDGGCKSSNIIFGIDDTLIQSQSENDELRLFSKTYRKMLDTSSPINILPPKDKMPLVIKFYGHSLGEADYSYFQSIFDYYNIYSNNQVGLKFYYSEGHEQTDAIYRLINSYGKTLANREQGKNLMHKLLLENRLKIEMV